MLKIVYFTLSAILGLLLITFLAVWFLVLKPEDRGVVLQRRSSIEMDGHTRKYRIFNGTESGEERPLVVLLHGFKDRAEWVAAYSGFNILAREEGFALLLPQGIGMSWNGVACCGYAFQIEADDSGFVLQAIEEARQEYKIDNSKIYVVGFSNGGFLAQKLLAEAPETFSAGAALMSAVGTNFGTVDISNARDPIMLVHGDNDKYISTDGTSESVGIFHLDSVAETIAAWSEQYAAELSAENETELYKETQYSNSEEVKVLHRLYYGQQHIWPQRRLWSFESEVPGLTRDIWNFLNFYKSN